MDFKIHLDNLMKTITDSNKLHPETVTGIIVTNSNFKEFEDLRKLDLFNLDSWRTDTPGSMQYSVIMMPKLTKAFFQILIRLHNIVHMVEMTKNHTAINNLEVGLRSENCEYMIGDFLLVANALQLVFPTRKNRVDEIWANLDFVICRQLPSISSTPMESAHTLIDRMNGMLQIFNERWPKLKVIMETGWPTNGKTANGVEGNVLSMNQFWCEIDKWSMDNLVQVDFFTAFDGSPVSGKVSELKYGWWIRIQEDQSGLPTFVEKVNYAPQVIRRSVTSPLMIILIVVGCIVSTAVVIVLVYFKQKSTMNRFLTKEELIAFKIGFNCSEGEGDFELPYDHDYEIPENRIHIDENQLLGKGTFGVVFHGRLDGTDSDVAFNIRLPNRRAINFKSLLSEIKILTHVGNHPNVVSIIGVYTEEIHRGMVVIALELCEKGSLKEYLKLQKLTLEAQGPSRDGDICVVNKECKINREDLLEKLVVFAYDVSSGMEHIAWKNIIHADLAARNVLLTAGGTAKITDFGLSKHKCEYQDYAKKNLEPLPWRWMAVESLEEQTFSTKSDVWSFGVTLYEMFSLCDIPYKGLSWNQNFSNLLREGLQLEKPFMAPSELYGLMQSCFLIDPQQRPTFTEVKIALQRMHPKLEKNAYFSVACENKGLTNIKSVLNNI